MTTGALPTTSKMELGLRGRMFSLLNTTGLALLMCFSPFLSQAAQADQVVDASTQTVNGGGGGTIASPWVISGALKVGVSADATLNIINGGQVTSSEGRVGYGASSTTLGTVAISGGGSSWTVTDELDLGHLSAGALTIGSGGSVTDTMAILGVLAGSVGSATVTGTDSTWTSSGNLVIGSSGSGTVTVGAGGTVRADSASIANFGGSTGTVTVSGAGANFTTSQILEIGYHGTGTMTVADGGAVHTVIATIAAQSGAIGTLNIGAASGDAAAAPGSFDARSVAFGSGTGKIVFNHTSTGYAFTVPISGGGELDQIAGTTILSGDSSAFTGSTRVTGGTLQIAGRLGGTGNIENGGTVIVSGSGSSWPTTGNLSVGFSGAGTLNITDGGTASDLIGYIGFNAGSNGVVKVDGTGSSWTSQGNLAVGLNGDGTLTIANGGTVTAGNSVKVAFASGVNGTINIGAALGHAAVAPGTLNAPEVAFQAGSGTLVFNHTGTNYTFSPVISGSGDIEQVAGTTILTGNSSGFSGLTDVLGGTLDVNGSLGNSVGVLSGGTLKGSGTIGAITIGSAGTVAPGNSIGTLTTGSVIFNVGSTYQVEIDASGNSDVIHSTGTATINGGTVKVIPYPGLIVGTPYTILKADGGKSGAGFSGAAFPSASLFVMPTLSGDANHVYLTINQTANFDTAALTPNQAAAAQGVQSTGGGTLFGAIATLGNSGAARAAFDAISGEIHASAKSALIDDSRFIREAALDRLRRSPGSGKAFWGHVFGGFGHMTSDGNAAAMDTYGGGLVVGADGSLPGGWRMGLLAGYSRLAFNVSDRASSGNASSFHLGAYGGKVFSNLAVRLGGAYSLEQLDISRSMAFNGFADNLSSNYTASTAQAFGELAYKVKVGQSLFEPFANLAYVRQNTGGFHESGSSAALTGQSDVIGATFSTLGLRAQADLPLGQALKAKVTAMVGWQHGLGNVTPQATLHFAGGNPFVISGTPLAEDSAVVEGGLNMQLSSTANLDLAYTGRLAAGTHEQSLKASFHVQF